MSETDETFEIEQPKKEHPDYYWLSKITGWKLAGTLTFRHKFLDTENSIVKDFFGRYHWHLNGDYKWKNVPVYWRWEFDKNERLHCHFVMIDNHYEFDWLTGCDHKFKNPAELTAWLKRNWKHGTSEYSICRDNGWLEYITKKNSLMDSCFSPPIHYLKREVVAGRDGCFFPRLHHHKAGEI